MNGQSRVGSTATARSDSTPIGGRALRFLKEGVRIWFAVAAIFAVGSLALPRLYESTVLLEIGAAAGGSDDGPAAERQVRAATDDPKTLSSLSSLEDSNPSKDALQRAQKSVRVQSRTARTFEVSYRARTSDLAKRGCTVLTDAVVAHFSSDSGAATKSADEARANLRQKTKELTDYVVAHPERIVDSTTGARPTNAAARPPTLDPAVGLLRQEKARIEAEIATSEGTAKAPAAHDNPYDEPTVRPDVTQLQQRLVEIRNAILAHQRAITASVDKGPGVAAAPPDQGAEWRSLARAVADAQRAAYSSETIPAVALVARILEPPSTPLQPVESWRGVVVFLGVVFGLVIGVLWVLCRTLTDRREALLAVQPARPLEAPIALVAATENPRARAEDAAHAAEAALVDTALSSTTPPARNRSAPDQGTWPAAAREPSPAILPDGNVRIPKAPAMPTFGPGQTQIGMVDPAIFAAQPPPPTPDRVASSPILDVTREGRVGAGLSPVPAGTTVTSKFPRSPLPPRPTSSVPPRPNSSGPPRPTSSVPPRPTPPVPQQRTGSATRSGPPPSRRPGESSGIATPRGPRSPLRDDAPPITQRMGSPESGSGERDSVPPRSETGYSFVDPSARAGARRRQSDRSQEKASATREEARPSRAPLEARFSEPAEKVAPQRTVPGGMNTTQVGWRKPTPPETVVETAIVPHRSHVSSRPPEHRHEELVTPRSAPPSWRLGPAVADGGQQDELRALCEQILGLSNQRCFVVGVTSDSDLGGGKSRTAARLAAMLAEHGRIRVLLMEANFDFPAVQRLMAIEIPHASGFSQQMRARIKTGARRPWVVVRCSASLDVLAEGVVRSPGISFSQEFSEAVDELRRCYDVIVADGSIVGVGADHKPLDAVSDGLIYAVSSGAVLSDALDRATKWFKRKELIAAVPVESRAQG